MIIIRVELHSAITGQVRELARMMIHNTGGTESHGDYEGLVYRGRDAAALDKRIVHKRAQVLRHPRLNQHVWNLIARMLGKMGYR